MSIEKTMPRLSLCGHEVLTPWCLLPNTSWAPTSFWSSAAHASAMFVFKRSLCLLCVLACLLAANSTFQRLRVHEAWYSKLQLPSDVRRMSMSQSDGECEVSNVSLHHRITATPQQQLRNLEPGTSDETRRRHCSTGCLVYKTLRITMNYDVPMILIESNNCILWRFCML